jgi:hypothetical protein
MENQLFIIPIYLRSPSQYEMEAKIKEQNEIEKYGAIQFGRKYKLNWPLWQYNDVIGYFDILVNSHKVISVTKYLTESKRISRNPNERKKHAIALQFDFSLTPSYNKLVQYFNNQEIELKQRIKQILNDLNKIVNKEKHFIDISYYNNLLDYLDIEGFISTNNSI